MKLQYLPQPGMSAGAGVGSALGSLGKTASDLGQLSLDEKERKNKAETENLKLSLMQKADTRADGELKLNQDKLAFQKDETQAEKLDKALKARNMVAAFRAAHPNATKHFNDEQLMAWGNDIDKLLPKDEKIDKIDARVTPDGDKILTFMQGGKIVEKNMGKVKTDWNEGKDAPSSEIPGGHIAVDAAWLNYNKIPLKTKMTKDGRVYASVADFNEMLTNRDESTKKELRLKSVEEEENAD